jgi:nitroreductase
VHVSTAEETELNGQRSVHGTADQVLERLLAGWWSRRAFEPRAVPCPTAERMLSLAQQAASWCTAQPRQVIVTAGEGTEHFRAASRANAEKLRSSFGAAGIGALLGISFAYPDRQHPAKSYRTSRADLSGVGQRAGS